MQLKNQLGKNIKYYRNKKKYTQEQLAEMVGISDKNISKIENGINFPSAETLSAIAKTLQVEYYELFLFSDEIQYEQMKEEIIQALNNKKTIISLYKFLKNI